MRTREPIRCADGTIISVQASSGHYCSPRSDITDKGYGAVEVRINSDNPLGWMPAAKVMELITKHGGALSGQLPPLNFGFHVLSTDGDTHGDSPKEGEE